MRPPVNDALSCVSNPTVSVQNWMEWNYLEYSSYCSQAHCIATLSVSSCDGDKTLTCSGHAHQAENGTELARRGTTPPKLLDIIY
jgi:hypothetical protein